MALLSSALIMNKLELHNRIVLPPLATEKSAEGGRVSKALLEYYDAITADRAIGLVIVEHSFVHLSGKASASQLSVDSNASLSELRTLANTIQNNGSKAIMQISHAGSAASEVVTGSAVIGPSAIANPRKGIMPRAMTLDEIDEIVQSFISSARLVKGAGFDGVEIHSAHGYFLNQFYSPLTNLRDDAYGGSLEKRVKIHLEIIRGVREAVGNEFPILLRLGASDYSEGGTTLEDSMKVVPLFEEAGVDIIDISGGFCGYTGNESNEEGYFSELSGPIMQVTKCPVILTGGILSAEKAETLLIENQASLIGVGRAMLKDHHWAKKAIVTVSN